MAKRFENPLLSDRRLREMYTAMVEARVFGEGAARGKSGARLEACWAGSAIGLRDNEGDFACAGDGVGLALDLLLGQGWKAVLRGERSAGRLELRGAKPMERMCFALGAARGLAAGKKVGLVYAAAGELGGAEWKTLFGHALEMELPVVFVVTPKKAGGGVAELGTRCGVPGIPVDASDAVAMYRVAQESMGRARAGGGPALIEAVALPRSGDPIALLGSQLVRKKVATERWLAGVEARVRARGRGKALPPGGARGLH